MLCSATEQVSLVNPHGARASEEGSATQGHFWTGRKGTMGRLVKTILNTVMSQYRGVYYRVCGSGGGGGAAGDSQKDLVDRGSGVKAHLGLTPHKPCLVS